MIGYLVTAAHRYTVDEYLRSWAPELRSIVRVLPYESLSGDVRLPRASYIFSDLERLSGPMRRRAEDMAHRLARDPESSTVLNSPTGTLVRHDLLRLLRERGSNEFGAYRLSETRTPERFPVFLREEDSHGGAMTPLLHTQRELDRTIARLYLGRRTLDNLLMIEFCDTSDDRGIYRKYGTYIVGSRIIPKHMMFSRDWSTKHTDLVDEARLEEEREFLETNPHREELRAIFHAAGVTYGRADYGILDGRIQVWEINTNPMILRPGELMKPERLPFKTQFAERMARAFEAVDTPGTSVHTPALPPSGPGLRVPSAQPGMGLRHRLAARPRIRSTYRLLRRPFRRLGDGVLRLLQRPVIGLLERTRWRGGAGQSGRLTRRRG
jgi:hypothetical protein